MSAAIDDDELHRLRYRGVVAVLITVATMPTQVNLEALFPVIVAVIDADDALRESIRRKVYKYLEGASFKRDVAPSPIEAMETSYFSGRAFLRDAELDELERHVIGSGEEFLRWFGVNNYPLEIERSWINIFRPGMQEMQHAHEGSVLSCSYYVEAPENCGDFVIQDPIGARRAHRAFTNTNANTAQTMQQYSYPPKAGRMVMFESWLPHAVLGNKSGKVRISIAMNLRRKDAAT